MEFVFHLQLLIVFILCSFCYCQIDIIKDKLNIVPSVSLLPTPYYKWAHLHWIWLVNSEGNAANCTNLVDGYKSRNIPVGGLNIDSTWETAYNNFEVDTTKFADLKGFIDSMHNQNINVIMWATSMVNIDNPEYQYAKDNKYFVTDKWGEARALKWWKGSGSLIDYTNPDAMVWWHDHMSKVLDAGLDGFKTDATDPYILEYEATGGAFGANGKKITYREYADYYYHDFLKFSRQKRGPSSLIMQRPVDCLNDADTSVCMKYSPQDIMFSGWVGDDDGTFNGLRGCMRKVIYSAWDNYANFGCDIGGYRGSNTDPTKEVFLRWAQLGAFLPLMENGGGGEHRPWLFDDETVDIYRNMVNNHHRLAYYQLQTGTKAIETGTSSIIPLAQRTKPGNNNMKYQEPSTWSYQLGNDIVVHPALNDITKKDKTGAAVSTVHMIFPSDENTLWLDWWNPIDLSKAEVGGTEKRREVILSTIPVYVRQNSYLPLQAKDGETPVFTWFVPVVNTAVESSIREPLELGNGMMSNAKLTMTNDNTQYKFDVQISGHSGKGSIELIGVGEPITVNFESAPLSGCVHIYESHSQSLLLECLNIEHGMKATILTDAILSK